MIWHHKEIDSNSPARNRWDGLLSYFVTYVPRWASLCHSSLSALYDFSFKEPPLKFIIGIITPSLIFLGPVCISLLNKVPFFYSLFFFFFTKTFTIGTLFYLQVMNFLLKWSSVWYLFLWLLQSAANYIMNLWQFSVFFFLFHWICFLSMVDIYKFSLFHRMFYSWH